MSANPFSLEGKTILVTGASSGIGKATAIGCSKLGATVWLLARNREKLNVVLGLLEGKDKNHGVIVADLSKEEELLAIISELPQLDGLVSNAGTSEIVPLTFYNLDKLEKVFSVNTFAPMLLVRALLKKKKLNKLASVVFTTSIGGVYLSSKSNGIYESSKNALYAYMRVAALELASKGIRVNSVSPGMVDTDFIHGGAISDEQLEKDKKMYALGRYGTPFDIAHAIIYLLSDAAGWVTGTDIKIDGGRTLI